MDIDRILNLLEDSTFDIAAELGHLSESDLTRIVEMADRLIEGRRKNIANPPVNKRPKPYKNRQNEIIRRLETRAQMANERIQALQREKAAQAVEQTQVETPETQVEQPAQPAVEQTQVEQPAQPTVEQTQVEQNAGPAQPEQPAQPAVEQTQVEQNAGPAQPEQLPFSLDAQATIENDYARTHGIQIVRADLGVSLNKIAPLLAGKSYICNFNGFEIDGTKYKTGEEIIAAYEQHIEEAKKKDNQPQPEQPAQPAVEQTQVEQNAGPAQPEQPNLTDAEKRQKANEATYGRQVQRMKDSETLNKVTERINAARAANVSANSLRTKLEQTKTGFAQRMSELEAKLEQIKTATSKAIAVIESEMRAIEMSSGTKSDDYRLLAAQLVEERKKEKKEQRTQIKEVQAEKRAAEKAEKKEEKAINSQIRAQDKAERKETRRAGVKADIRRADEAKRQGEELDVRQERRQYLLHQRDRLAAELNQMRALYGTANNEEYQVRIEQLKELDKKIFGHKATRIYRDLSKPIALIGGDYVEIPKKYLDMRVEHQDRKK